MADIENEKKRSKNKGTKKSTKSARFAAPVDTSTDAASDSEFDAADETGSMTTGLPDASSWRDFITNASAALSGLSDKVEEQEAGAPAEVGLEIDSEIDAPIETSKKKRGKKKTAVESVDWNSETKDLEISEEEQASNFEMLARRVAQSVSENSDIMSDEPAAEPTAMGDDSGDSVETMSADQLGDEPETTFDMAAGEELQTEGEILDVNIDTDEAMEAADQADDSEERTASAADFEMSNEMTFEGGAEQLDMLAEETIVQADEQSDGQVDGQSDGPSDESDDSLEAVGEFDADGNPTNSSALSEVEEFITTDVLQSVCESLLFSTDKPVSVATVKQIFKNSNIKSKDITQAMETIAVELAGPTRGVTLEEVGGGYQLRTKSDNADYLRRLAKVRPFRLSGPALECMAMVAYKQPITKHEIDEIRGVESGHLLRALMERGLVCFNGKSDLPGKPMTYGSTRKFLETFGLRNLRELPTLSEIDELLPEGIGEVEEKETLSDITDSMSNEILGTYSEAEDELLKINEQLQAVDTTSEFFEQEKVRERERRDRDRAQDLRDKIGFGDEVDVKDRRWLDRYDAKLKAAEEAALNPVVEPITGPDGEISMAEAQEIAQDLEAGDREEQESPEFSSQLEALTEESGVEASSADDEDDEAALDGVDSGWMEQGSDDEEDMSDDDLSARPDWEDDESGEGQSH